MTTEQLFVILVILVALLLMVRRYIRMDVAALGIAVALALAQFGRLEVLGDVLDPNAPRHALDGFSQPVIVTLISLFIMTRALDKLGMTRWLARRMLALGGSSEIRLIALFTTAAAVLSLLMNNVAVGALLLPSAIDASRRSGIKASKLLMPVAYGTLLGGVATYFTTANILMSDILTTADPPQEPLHILDFTGVGGLIAFFGIAYIVLIGRRWLPERSSMSDQMDARRTGKELADAYAIEERLWQAQVMPGSPLINQTLISTKIGEWLGVAVVALIKRGRVILVTDGDFILQAGDTMIIAGREERVEKLTEKGVTIKRSLTSRHLHSLEMTMVEVLPAPRSNVEGLTLKELNFRNRYDMTAIAIWREGKSYRTDVADFKLRVGDSLLLVGAQDAIPRLRSSRDFIVLETDTSDQPMDKPKVLLAGSILGGAIVASVIGVPVYLAMLTGALLTVLMGLLNMEEAYRSISWQTIFLIAGMYTVSLAMVQTHLAERIGEGMVEVVTPFGAVGLIAGCYLLAMILTQFMGSQVTALVIGPIAISAAITLGINPQAIAVATAIGCSAAFITPMSHPINMLVMAPGAYSFGDFVRLGWGLMLVSFLILLLTMPIFWNL